MNKIFINIASYRDKELIPTIRDAIEKAKSKERLSFGICWQYDETDPLTFGEKEDDLFKGVQINYERHHYSKSQGMGWARKISQSFWKDEGYQLQIDSHMRFSKDWDWQLLNLVNRCHEKYKSKKIIITSRTLPYYPEKGGECRQGLGTYMQPSKFRENGVLTLTSGSFRNKQNLRDPVPGAFVSGHYLFSSSRILKEMPYDESFGVISTGDEPILSIKAWTRGWDIFYPHKVIIWHHFYREGAKKNHSDLRSYSEKLSNIGVNRFNEIIDGKMSDKKYALGDERTLDDYKNYCGVDYKNKTIDTKIVFVDGIFDKNKIAEKLVKKFPEPNVKSFNISPSDGKEKIFVQIASYRDPDIINTLNDLFQKADKPEKLLIGICDQYGPENKHYPIYDKPEIRIMRVPFYISTGLGWARSSIQKLYFENDAEYTMQLDSHMRFANGWDTKLKEMMALTGSPKPILSHYCTGFNLAQKNEEYLNRKELFRMYCLRFNPTGTVSFRQGLVLRQDRKGKPLPSMLISGHFYFTLAKHIKEYKYDPNLYFAGDEISLATRSWTNGWDIFTPTENVVFHNFTREERVCHWADQKVSYAALHEESHKRLRQMLHRENNGFDLGEYCLGKERSLEAFEEASGIDFIKRTLLDHAKSGIPKL